MCIQFDQLHIADLSAGKSGPAKGHGIVYNLSENVRIIMSLGRIKMLMSSSQNASVAPETIERLMAPFSMSNLRLPLQAAMTYSPLCLLSTTTLNLHSVSEDRLCQVSEISWVI